LVFAPLGRDAQLAAALLSEAGIAAAVCPHIAALGEALGPHTTFVVAAEEAMRNVDLNLVRSWLKAQPTWSDLPFIVLTQRGGGPESNPAAQRLSDTFGNVTFLERPFHPTTFASLARTALKARMRQYEARDRLQDLHESQDRLATALLAGNLGDWEYDLMAGQLMASALCKANYGRAPDDPFSYDDLLASIHPEDRDRMQAAVRRSIDSGEDYNIEYRVLWPDGGLHWVQINARMINDASGAPLRMVGVSAEITTRKNAEANLRQLNETLERRVAERTDELVGTHAKVLEEIRQREQVEDQLRQAQKMEMIGQLTGGVAHDFNNLLMAVLGNLDLLRKHVPEDPRAMRLIDGALQGAKRGAALTQRLLAFARRQSLQVEPADISGLVAGMRDLIERSVGPGIDLQIRLRDGLPKAMVDSNQIELALLNLVVNARDAMPEGGVLTIDIDRARASEADDLAAGDYLRLSVTDTGVGMDAETLRHAVEPFFSTKELGKGTGLGLSMIHGLAVQLQGVLRLRSKPGAGTTAELYLPAASASEASMAETAASPAPVETGNASRSRILLVDDDFLIAMSTADMLADLGHEVIEASSGRQALDLLQKTKSIDLIITDFAMPGMTGLQLAEAAWKLAPGMPILLATGYAEIPSGSDVTLPRIGKPYSQAQLAREIARLLPEKVGADASA
jgi:signal transduction histidine kinase